jgi:hypothetical protein
MAVIHIPEAEALKDFATVLSKYDRGDQVVIDRPLGSVTLIGSAPDRPLTFAEAIARLPKSSTGVIDEEFEADVRRFRERHPESFGSSEWD